MAGNYLQDGLLRTQEHRLAGVAPMELGPSCFRRGPGYT